MTTYNERPWTCFFLSVVFLTSVGCPRPVNPPPAERDAAAQPQGTLQAKVRVIVAEHLGVQQDDVASTKTLAALGADELDVVEIIMQLEDEFQVLITDEAIEREAGSTEISDFAEALRVSSLENLVRTAIDDAGRTTSP